MRCDLKLMRNLVLPLFLLFSVSVSTNAQSISADPAVLLGKWKLDMTPQDKSDSNFALMNITSIDGSTFEGEFYREGVEIRDAQINTQLDIIYGALVSGDNSGTYNTAFYYDDGVLKGTTHSIDRKFLAVWTATKE